MNPDELHHLTRSRIVPVTIVIVAIAAAAGFLVGVSGGIEGLTLPLASVPQASIDAPFDGSTTTEGLIKVEGFVWASRTGAPVSYPPASVELEVNYDLVDVTSTSKTGNYRFGNVSLRKGKNTIRIDVTENMGWRRFELSRQASITFVPAVPTVPKIDPIPATTSSDTVTIGGAADPAVIVKILRTTTADDGTVAVDEIAQQLTDATTGRFSVQVRLYPPGSYGLTAFAVDYKGAESKESPSQQVTYDPSVQSTPRMRRLQLNVSATSLHAEVELILTADDQRGRNWLNGRLTLAQLLDQVFGPLDISGRPLSEMFVGVDGTKRLSADQLDITAVSNPEFEYLHLTNRLAVHVTEGTFLSSPDDSLTLLVRDYRVTTVDPQPSGFSGGGPIWHGPIGLTDPYLSAGLEIRDASPFVLLRLRPYDVASWPATTLVGFLYALMNGLGLLWFLYLVRIHPTAPWPSAGLARRLPVVAERLLAVCFVPSIMDLVRAAADPLGAAIASTPSPLGVLPLWVSEPYRAYATVAIIGLIIVSLPRLILHKRVDTVTGYMVGVGLRAIWTTFALTAIIFLVIAAWWDLPLFIAYQYVAWAINGTVLAILLFHVSGMVLDTFAAGSWAAREPGRKRLVRITFVAVALLAAIPMATTVYKVAGIGSPDSLADAVRAAFQLFQYYSSYVVLIGVLAVLRAAARGEMDRTGPLVIGLGLLVFAYFMVNTDPYFFVPLSFLLGVSLFWLVLVVPKTERNALLGNAKEVRTKRAALLLQLEDTSQAKQLRSAVDALIKLVADGTMTPETFASRKASLKTYLASHQESTKVGGRPGERVVLAVGPMDDDWANGLYGALIGFVVAIPWLVLYFTVFVVQAGEISTPVKPLVISALLAAEPFNWALMGFFFGYFFTYIRGTTGLRKGLWIAFVYSLCMAPYWLTSPRNAPEALSTALVVCTNILVFAVIGLVFDIKTLREGLGDGFGWSSFGRLTGLGSLTAFGSVILATLGVSLTSVLSGEFVSIAGLLIHAVGAPIPLAPGH